MLCTSISNVSVCINSQPRQASKAQMERHVLAPVAELSCITSAMPHPS